MALDKEELIKRVRAGEKLTDEEEFFYLTAVVGMSADDARRIIKINKDYSDTNIIDF